MADAPQTPEERLVQVREAIQAVLYGGQSYKIGSRSLTRADLALLRTMEKELAADVAAAEASPFMDDTYVAVFTGTGR